MAADTKGCVAQAEILFKKWHEVYDRCTSWRGDALQYSDEGKQELLDLNASLGFFSLKENEELGMSAKVNSTQSRGYSNSSEG